ncbi:hypothetical protein CWR48_15810 [Oceanobacillus arenosus]|uniref:Uncharacterized protein n=1 Tax=Oceanobacillus arenosus TaxID=1229153 RepID=A0A3D8PMQ4_9BACI|nr:hypothetical protein [Oceanobacillus arenosus]RDW16511.1 hypothetical protein CWR48_15810 [Oceanobacillus arenosus]
MFYAIGLITGIIIGYFINSVIRILKKGLNFKVIGYVFSIRKVNKVEVIDAKKKYKKMHI